MMTSQIQKLKVRKAKKHREKVCLDLRSWPLSWWIQFTRFTWKELNQSRKGKISLKTIKMILQNQSLHKEKRRARSVRWRSKRKINSSRACRIKSLLEMEIRCSDSRRTIFCWYTTHWYSSGTIRHPTSISFHYWWLAFWCLNIFAAHSKSQYSRSKQ